MKRKLFDRVKNFKPADQPRKAEKAYRPPGHGARRFGQVSFWTLQAVMVLLIFILVVNVMQIAKGAAPPEEEPENLAASAEAVDFAKAFAATYFTWTPTAEGWERQAAQLAPMLAKNVPPTAGLVHANQEWSSAPTNARLLEIEETGTNKSLITLAVDQRLTRKDGKKDLAETATHTFTVPVAWDAAFAVYDLPSFTAVPTAHDVETEQLTGKAADAATEQNVRNFLTTFFQSYASDAPDKLSYFLEGENVQGLNGSVEFDQVKNVTVIVTATGYDAQALVTMREPKTGSLYETTYRLSVTEKDGRFVVTKLNEGEE